MIHLSLPTLPEVYLENGYTVQPLPGNPEAVAVFCIDKLVPLLLQGITGVFRLDEQTGEWSRRQ